MDKVKTGSMGKAVEEVAPTVDEPAEEAVVDEAEAVPQQTDEPTYKPGDGAEAFHRWAQAQSQKRGE